MNDEIYNVALRNALTGIKDAMVDLNWSFILTSDGTVITGDDRSVDPAITKAASSFQTLAEKATAIGNLDNMLLDGEKCKIYVSSINDMYLVAGLAKDADLVYFRTITQAVLPTVLKVLDAVTASPATAPTVPTPLKPTPIMPISPSESSESILTKQTMSEPTVEDEQAEDSEKTTQTEQPEEPEEATELETELQVPEKEETPKQQPQEIPSQQLIVDRFSGLMVKSDTVQLDAEILKRWSTELGVENVGEVDVETFSGRTVRCKTKVINDPKLEGRGLIRIPEKTCQTLDVRRGELIRVRPVTPQESE